MTKKIQRKNGLVLAVTPSSKGFGYCVLEAEKKLVDWGVKTVTGDKNSGTIRHVKKMIVQYKPSVMVLHDASNRGSRRGPRIRKLTKQIARTSAGHKIRVTFIPRERMMQMFFIDGKGTKHTIAKILAGRFPEELGRWLPPKRKAWESEDVRMSMFEAVALATAWRLKKE